MLIALSVNDREVARNRKRRNNIDNSTTRINKSKMAGKIRRKSIADPTPRTAIRRKTARSRANENSESRIRGLVLPICLSVCLLICLAVLGHIGLKSVTATKFFDLKEVRVAGTERSSSEDIERIVTNAALKTGVWNADLAEIRARIEKEPFVHSVSITRMLPDGIRVNIVERIPIAVVKLKTGDMLVDGDANLLAPPGEREEKLPIALLGWDESKTEKAFRENKERVKLYQQMLAEWQEGGLIARVHGVNLADIREPKALTEDSGKTVTIDVGRNSFAKHLKNGVTAIAGKGDMFDAVTLIGPNMILSSRKQKGETEGSN